MFVVTFQSENGTEVQSFTDILDAYCLIGKIMTDYPYLGKVLEFHCLQDHTNALAEWNALAATDGRTITVQEVST